jgi:hypothetical protein
MNSPVRGKECLACPRATQRVACVLLTAALAGCSLLSIKSPEVPLTPHEQAERLLTRDFAARFVTAITHALDRVSSSAADPAIRAQALRLKLGAVTEMTRASTGLSPTESLIDSWAFSIQLRDFLVGGAGNDLLGDAQAELQNTATELADDADRLARRVLDKDYERYRTLVANYTQANVLVAADCSRPSILSLWSAAAGDTNPLHSAGTVSQALGDVSDRLRIYGERAPSLALWQAELELDRSGFDAKTYHEALRNIDTRLERISRLADTSPQLAREAIAELRFSLRTSSDRLDESWLRMLKTLREEREALTATMDTERDSVTSTLDIQRSRLTQDASVIADRAIETSWHELRKLVREMLLLATLLVLVLLGLPFAAGYLLGRRRAAIARDPSADSP